MKNKTFKAYYKRLAVEGVLKALLWGLTAGFLVGFVVAFATWFTPFNGLWLAIGLTVGIAAAVTLVLYYRNYRPTVASIAKRLDKELGLEERMITMAQFENDESYIAVRQREDALQALGAVSQKRLKFNPAMLSVILASVSVVAGGSAIAVTGAVASPVAAHETTYLVQYAIEGEGAIEGETDQIVVKGENASLVVAVPADGWYFVGWIEDGKSNPVRNDAKVKGDGYFTALFERVDEIEEDKDESDGVGLYFGNQTGNQQQDPDPDSLPGKGAAGGGDFDSQNYIHQNNWDYHDFYDGYHTDVQNQLGDGGLTSEESSFTNTYWDTIK